MNLEKWLNVTSRDVSSMALLMDVAMLFSGLNIVVLVALMYIYGRLAIRSKAVLSFGLVVFALILLTQNILTLFAYYTMEPLFGAETMPILSTSSALQFVAYVLLLKFTV